MNKVEAINNMDSLQKLSVYMHYYITQLGLRYDFVINEDWSKKHLWKDIKIKTFDEFISSENIKTTDNGNNWQQNGNAQRIRVDCFGIYDWYWKFKDKICTP